MGAPVRVLSIANSLCFGGAEKHTVTLLNKLDPRRFDCTLAYLKPDEALLPQVETSKLRAVLSLDVQSKFDWRAVKQLAHFYSDNDIDVVLCTNEYPTLYALAAAALTSNRPPKLIEVFHTTLYRTIKEKLQMLLYRNVFRRLDLLVYVSSRQREFWRSKGLRGKHDIVIHNGIDPSIFCDTYSHEQKIRLRSQLGFEGKDYIAAMCAALRPEKAHIDFLEALVRLKKRDIHVKGLLIGDGVERDSIERAIDEFDLRDSVVVTGFRSDVRPYLAVSDIVVLASRSIETFSVAALEAMAMGKPLVLTQIGGAEEQVSNGVNGFLFEPGDVEKLACHLASLTDVQKRLRMGQAAAERVRLQFSEQQMISSFSTQLIALRNERLEGTREKV